MKNNIVKIDIMVKQFILYLITFLAIEIIFALLSGFNIIDWSLLRIFLSVSIFSIVIAFIEIHLPKKIQNYFKIMITLVYTLFAIIQFGFKNYLGVYASINASSQVGAVTSYIKEFITAFDILSFTLLIPFIFSIYFINKYKLDEIIIFNKTIILKRISVLSLVMTIFTSCYLVTLNNPFFKSENLTTSLNHLFNDASQPSLSVRNFGLNGFFISDLKYYLFGKDDVINIYDSEYLEEVVDVNRNIDDTLWMELLFQEENENYKIIHEYLLSRQMTSYNDYTGIFEGKNVIFVMMESVNDIITYQEYFPNFAKMMNNGIYYENNYSPRNSCPTGNNEFSGITSLYSIYNSCTANDYKTNIYPQSIFNSFSNLGYNVISMHNYNEHYYYRSIIHPNLGAQQYYGVADLNISYDQNNYKNWSSDKEFATAAMEIMETEYGLENNFALWLTTVSAHQPYTVDSNESIIYQQYFTDLGYTGVLNRYLSKLKLTDDLFGILLETLEEKSILEDTVIVTYGDHYPYGLGDSIIEDFTGRQLIDYEEDKVPLLIYNSNLDAKTVSDYTTFINIAPTVLNLFNIDYDPRLYFGKDLNSEEFTSRAVFSDGSWKNEYAYFDASKSEIKYYSDFTYTPEQLEAINTLITNDMTISTNIIKLDYFNNLYSKLNTIAKIKD